MFIVLCCFHCVKIDAEDSYFNINGLPPHFTQEYCLQYLITSTFPPPNFDATYLVLPRPYLDSKTEKFSPL